MDTKRSDSPKKKVNFGANAAKTFFFVSLAMGSFDLHAVPPIETEVTTGNRFILCVDGTKIMWPSLGNYYLLARKCGGHGGVKTVGDNGHPNGIFPPPPPPPMTTVAAPSKSIEATKKIEPSVISSPP